VKNIPKNDPNNHENRKDPDQHLSSEQPAGPSSDGPETATPKPHPFGDEAGDGTPPDPFDPKRLALSGNPADAIGVKRALVHVPVRKPNRQEFFRVHPDPTFRLRMAILDIKTEREVYAVLPDVAAAIPGETRLVELTTCVNRQGNIFLWPVPLPGEDGRELAWHTTAREGAARAEHVWVRMVPNMGAGAYDIYEARATIAKPTWGEHSFQNLLRVAFGNGRLIESVDHPVIKQLLGKE